MKKLMLFLSALLITAGYAHATPPGTISVVASNIVDSTGTPLVSGTVYFAPVDNKGNSTSYRMGTSGQSLARPVSTTVTNGAFSISLPDTSVTVPLNVCFNVSIIDNSTGADVLGQGYSCVQPSSTLGGWCTSTVCNFDNYTPNLAASGIVYPSVVSIGTVTTGLPGTAATVTVGGTTPHAILNFTLPQGIQGPIGGPTSGVNLTPTVSQSVIQPPTTSLDSNVFNHIYNAALFTGSDIGVKTNAAISALLAAYGGGIVEIPSGSYSFSHAITVPQGITVRGHGDGTVLNWTGAHAAIVLAQACIPNPGCAAAGLDTFGYLKDLTLIGTNTVGQIGIYQGGDPTGVNSPVTDAGYNYNLDNINERNMDIGTFWGNGAFNISRTRCDFSYNLTLGWSYPVTSTFGGQHNVFLFDRFQGNPSGAWNINQQPAVTFESVGADIEYNTGLTGFDTHPMMTGGTFALISPHIESFFGPFIEVSGNDGSYIINGGIIVVNSVAAATDPYMILMDAGRNTVQILGSQLVAAHTITNMVTQTTGSGNTPQVYVRNITLQDTGFFLKHITSLTGQGIVWCMPFDNSNGVNPGSCYDGNNYLNPVVTTAHGLNPSTFFGSAAAMQWNGDNTSGGVDYYDTFSAASSSAYVFRFNANISGTYTPLFTMERDGDFFASGAVQALTHFQVNSIPGITHTVAVPCGTMVFTGGILTGVTGTC